MKSRNSKKSRSRTSRVKVVRDLRAKNAGAVAGGSRGAGNVAGGWDLKTNTKV